MTYPQLGEVLTGISGGFLVLLVARRLLWTERTEARQRRFIQQHGLLRLASMESLLLLPASVAIGFATYLQDFSAAWYALSALLAVAAILPPAMLAAHPRTYVADLSPESIREAVARRRKLAPIYVAIVCMWLTAWYTRA